MNHFSNLYLQKIISLSTESKYLNWYCEIISKALIRAQTRKQAISILRYVEGHHILPRGFKLGGNKDPLNYAYLTAREHFICHRLLTKFCAEEYKTIMFQACKLMCSNQLLNQKVTSRTYNHLRSNGLFVPWNKGKTGLTGTPCSDKNKRLYSNLYKGKKRTPEDKEKMKQGWIKKKESGYQVWNKGLITNKPSATAIKCTFIDPNGSKYEYESMRQGCLALHLPTCKISEVKTGKLPHYKGWTVQITKKAKNE